MHSGYSLVGRASDYRHQMIPERVTHAVGKLKLAAKLVLNVPSGVLRRLDGLVEPLNPTRGAQCVVGGTPLSLPSLC
eukprot:1384238-Amphidinium_carterae.1